MVRRSRRVPARHPGNHTAAAHRRTQSHPRPPRTAAGRSPPYRDVCRSRRAVRVLLAFLTSFVLSIGVAALVLPDTASRASRRGMAHRYRSSPAPAPLDLLPGLPSVIPPGVGDAARRQENAWRLLKAGRYAETESAYLEILTGDPDDRQAMQALVALERLLAGQDAGALERRAAAYRREIAAGPAAEEDRTAGELEVLARASETGAQEIAAERRRALTALSRVSLPPASAAAGRQMQRGPSLADPLAVVAEPPRRPASSLGLAPPPPGLPSPPAYRAHEGLMPATSGAAVSGALAAGNGRDTRRHTGPTRGMPVPASIPQRAPEPSIANAGREAGAGGAGTAAGATAAGSASSAGAAGATGSATGGAAGTGAGSPGAGGSAGGGSGGGSSTGGGSH
jgi:hypothetical protein